MLMLMVMEMQVILHHHVVEHQQAMYQQQEIATITMRTSTQVLQRYVVTVSMITAMETSTKDVDVQILQQQMQDQIQQYVQVNHYH